MSVSVDAMREVVKKIDELKRTIVALEGQNQKLQKMGLGLGIIGVILAVVEAFDILLRILGK